MLHCTASHPAAPKRGAIATAAATKRMPLAPPTPKVARSFSESGRVPEDALRVPREREVHFEVDGPHQDAPQKPRRRYYGLFAFLLSGCRALLVQCSNILITKIINLGIMRGGPRNTAIVVEFSVQRVLGRFEHLIREYARSIVRNE